MRHRKIAITLAALLLSSTAAAFDGVPVPVPGLGTSPLTAPGLGTFPIKKVPTQRVDTRPPGPTPMPPDNMPVVGMAPRCACPIPLASANAKLVPRQVKLDAVPLQRWRDGRAVRLEALIVGADAPLLMLLDTGASVSQIPVKLADELVSRGNAKFTGTTRRADWPTARPTPCGLVSIDTVIVGQHAVHDVLATISVGGEAILGFPVLDGIAPFTIDTRSAQLIFHP